MALRIKEVEKAEEDLAKFEHDVRQYKIEYEQFFGGGKNRPPVDTEWRIEQMMKRYGDRGAEMNFSQRFLYNNLVQAFIKFRDMFRKRAKRIEEGSVERHFGAAARKIQTERAIKRKTEEIPPVSVVCSNPQREPRKVEKIYAAFRDVVERTGETAGNLTREQFEQFLQKKSEQLQKQQGSRNVEFVVSMEGGKARLKARVRS